MFGDDLIIGYSEGKIDEKGRIFIPAFTNPEPGDEIIIQVTTYEDELALKLTAYSEYLAIIDRFKKLRDNANSLEEYKKFSDEIEKICFELQCRVQIDKQRRLQIPKYAINTSGWQPKEELLYNGLGSSLLVRKKPQNK